MFYKKNIARAFEYFMDVEKLNLSAIRTVRVLRPLRAINRIPSKLNCNIAKFQSYLGRYENSGHASSGHPANAGECLAALLFCLLHLRNSWGPTLGWPTQTALLCQ